MIMFRWTKAIRAKWVKLFWYGTERVCSQVRASHHQPPRASLCVCFILTYRTNTHHTWADNRRVHARVVQRILHKMYIYTGAFTLRCILGRISRGLKVVRGGVCVCLCADVYLELCWHTFRGLRVEIGRNARVWPRYARK